MLGTWKIIFILFVNLTFNAINFGGNPDAV
jgi:hypothetical protein